MATLPSMGSMSQASLAPRKEHQFFVGDGGGGTEGDRHGEVQEFDLSGAHVILLRWGIVSHISKARCGAPRTRRIFSIDARLEFI